MEKLGNLVAGHIEDRFLQPERLEEVLASVLDHRQDRAERRREHIAELNKRAAETDPWLKRLYDAIEAGFADLNDPALRDRVGGLKAIRDQAQGQWVEVDDKEVRIIGSKSDPLPILPAASSVNSVTPGVRSSVLTWRRV